MLNTGHNQATKQVGVLIELTFRYFDNQNLLLFDQFSQFDVADWFGQASAHAWFKPSATATGASL